MILPSINEIKVFAVEDVANWEYDSKRMPIGFVDFPAVELFGDDGRGADPFHFKGRLGRKSINAHEIMEHAFPA